MIPLAASVEETLSDADHIKILERLDHMDERLKEIDRKLAAIMQLQDSDADRTCRILDHLIPPPEGSRSKYSR